MEEMQDEFILDTKLILLFTFLHDLGVLKRPMYDDYGFGYMNRQRYIYWALRRLDPN